MDRSRWATIHGIPRPDLRRVDWATLPVMSRGIFNWNWQDQDGRPLGNSGEQDLLRTKRQALRVLPGVTFAFAVMYLVVALTTVIGGDFHLGRVLSVIPALGAMTLAVLGRRRHSIGLCAAGLGVLVAWGGFFSLF